jgi:hypothetical protein
VNKVLHLKHLVWIFSFNVDAVIPFFRRDALNDFIGLKFVAVGLTHSNSENTEGILGVL